MITFDYELYDDFVFTNKQQAEERLETLKAEYEKEAAERRQKSYGHWLQLHEFKLVGESQL
jgi:hypothetical protein